MQEFLNEEFLFHILEKYPSLYIAKITIRNFLKLLEKYQSLYIAKIIIRNFWAKK